MQITNQARRIMSGTPNADGYIELKPPFVSLSKDDIADPIINIAAAYQQMTEILLLDMLLTRI